VSHDPTRKDFLAKVLGLATVGVLAPKAVASALTPAPQNKADGKSVAFRLRPQPLAVARRQGTA
jgi:hypothetical protein